MPGKCIENNKHKKKYILDVKHCAVAPSNISLSEKRVTAQYYRVTVTVGEYSTVTEPPQVHDRASGPAESC